MTDPSRSNPLPEPQWKFRRRVVWGVIIACLSLIAWIIHKISEGQYLAGVAYGLIGLCALVVTYYLIAPTAETLVKMAASVRLFRR